MKTITLKFTILLCLTFGISVGQITLDYVDTNHNYALGQTFYPVDIDNNETKYFFLDTATNQFDLYNMDFTPFMSNIQLPGSYDTYYFVMYISRQLFDCDTSNIEFIYAANWLPSAPFKIIRTDGTVLFAQDSTYAQFFIGCIGGTNDMRPIRKTSAGTKMFLGRYVKGDPYDIQTQVYSLCGTLPIGYTEIFNPLVSAANAYPNPASDEVVFEIKLPNNISKYDLTIYDQNGKIVTNEHGLTSTKHTVAISTFNSGNYFYSLTSNNKPFATGKIVSVK